MVDLAQRGESTRNRTTLRLLHLQYCQDKGVSHIPLVRESALPEERRALTLEMLCTITPGVNARGVLAANGLATAQGGALWTECPRLTEAL